MGVRVAEENGRLKFVKSTEYYPILDQQVRHGTHVFIFEDLTGRVLKASDFSNTGMVKLTPIFLCYIQEQHRCTAH